MSMRHIIGKVRLNAMYYPVKNRSSAGFAGYTRIQVYTRDPVISRERYDAHPLLNEFFIPFFAERERIYFAAGNAFAVDRYYARKQEGYSRDEEKDDGKDACQRYTSLAVPSRHRELFELVLHRAEQELETLLTHAAPLRNFSKKQQSPFTGRFPPPWKEMDISCANATLGNSLEFVLRDEELTSYTSENRSPAGISMVPYQPLPYRGFYNLQHLRRNVRRTEDKESAESTGKVRS